MYYPSSMVRASLGANRVRLAISGREKFESVEEIERIDDRQLELFNALWSRSSVHPFYAYWKMAHGLPDRIHSIGDLDSWPVLTKKDLRDNTELVNQTPGIDGFYKTSGSTGEPFDFPRGKIDFSGNYASQWSYRASAGLMPFDSFVLASNILGGAGVSRCKHTKERIIRLTKDALGNSSKVDGFLATDEDADSALEVIKRRRPVYLAGYPSAIAAIMRRAWAKGCKLNYLTHVVLTSECVEESDLSAIGLYRHVRVLIEYGTAEVGVIAGSAPGGSGWPLKTIWWHVLVRNDPMAGAVVTTLSDRVFPLVNFGLSDVISPDQVSPEGSVLSISDVRGRTRDVVTVNRRSGEEVPMMARELVYLAREIPNISSVQICQPSAGVVEYIVSADQNVDVNSVVAQLRSSVDRNIPDLLPGSVGLRFVGQRVVGARGKRSAKVNISDVSGDAPVIAVF